MQDIEALPWRPRMLNLKPARFGSVRALFDAYDHCAAHGIGAYGGGMFEQGPGRPSVSVGNTREQVVAVVAMQHHEIEPQAGARQNTETPGSARAYANS